MRALIVTHGRLGEELLASAREVHAVEASIDCLSNRDCNLNELVARIGDWLAQDDRPALLLVDVGAGSCGVAALKAAAERPLTWVQGGLNLPMLLTFLAHHDSLAPEALVTKMLDRAQHSVDRIGGA
jgi:mannose/fructose-specific phosphotransferase system component IIA